jgi:hypothetical protein
VTVVNDRQIVLKLNDLYGYQYGAERLLQEAFDGHQQPVVLNDHEHDS